VWEGIIMAKKWIEARLNGVEYKIYLEPFDGLCSPPKQEDREADIFLTKGFKNDRYTMEVLIHEICHSLDWSLSEEKVEMMGRDLSKVLWKLYRPRKGIT